MSRARNVLVVFDLDGTLVDTAPDLNGALNAALLGEGLSAVGPDVARDAIGHGARMMIKHGLAAQGSDAPDDLVSRMHERFLDHYRANIAAESTPFPGAVEALSRLEARGARLAVCTNKYEALARELLGALGLAQRFAAIAGGDTFGAAKPDPRHLTQTIAAAGGGAALMVGDSEADIGAARAAGVPCVAVSFGYSTVPVGELGADAVIDHFDALEEQAERLLAL